MCSKKPLIRSFQVSTSISPAILQILSPILYLLTAARCAYQALR